MMVDINMKVRELFEILKKKPRIGIILVAFIVWITSFICDFCQHIENPGGLGFFSGWIIVIAWFLVFYWLKSRRIAEYRSFFRHINSVLLTERATSWICLATAIEDVALTESERKILRDALNIETEILVCPIEYQPIVDLNLIEGFKPLGVRVFCRRNITSDQIGKVFRAFGCFPTSHAASVEFKNLISDWFEIKRNDLQRMLLSRDEEGSVSFAIDDNRSRFRQYTHEHLDEIKGFLAESFSHNGDFPYTINSIVLTDD